MKPLTKWNTVLDRSVDIPRVFRKAFESMTTGRPGAAHIALPFDVQNGPVERSDVWADPTLRHVSLPSGRAGSLHGRAGRPAAEEGEAAALHLRRRRGSVRG